MPARYCLRSPSCVSQEYGSKVLLVATDFPAITRPWLLKAKTSDYEVCFIHEVPETDLTNAIIEKVDSNTSVVCLSYVQFASGTQINVGKLSQHTKEVGAKLVIDVTQAAGAVPISINRLGRRYSGIQWPKWIGKPRGYCLWMVFRQNFRTGSSSIGWFGNENPFDMEATKLNLSKTAAKYTQSTLSYVSVVGLDVAIEQLLKIGIVEIMNHSDKLAEHLFSIIANSDWKAYRPTKSKGSSSHIVSLMHPSSDTIRRKFERLSEKGLICGIRNDRLRVSISHYNDSNDIEHLEPIYFVNNH